MLSTLVGRIRNRRPTDVSHSILRPTAPPYGMVDTWSAIDLAGMDVMNWAPAALSPSERLLLYSLTFCLRPVRYLEIGTLHGGSALIVAAAMDAIGTEGRMICVDLHPQIAPEHLSRLEKRATFLEGRSPDVLPLAEKTAGGRFDLAFIDGDHTYSGALADADAVISVMSEPRAYVVFHDAFNPDVQRALDDFVAGHQARLIDFGILTREVSWTRGEDSDAQTPWGGLRVMQVLPRS
jgi:predicted O-methyltransferase YrrM